MWKQNSQEFPPRSEEKQKDTEQSHKHQSLFTPNENWFMEATVPIFIIGVSWHVSSALNLKRVLVKTLEYMGWTKVQKWRQWYTE
jgi:hypothetical protein